MPPSTAPMRRPRRPRVEDEEARHERRHEHEGQLAPHQAALDRDGFHERGEPQDKADVRDVRAHDVAEADAALPPQRGRDVHRQLRRTRAEGDHGEAHHEGRDAQRPRQGRGPAHEQFAAAEQQTEAECEVDPVHAPICPHRDGGCRAWRPRRPPRRGGSRRPPGLHIELDEAVEGRAEVEFAAAAAVHDARGRHQRAAGGPQGRGGLDHAAAARDDVLYHHGPGAGRHRRSHGGRPSRRPRAR